MACEAPPPEKKCLHLLSLPAHKKLVDPMGLKSQCRTKERSAQQGLHTIGAPHTCAQKTLSGQSCQLVKIRKTSQNKLFRSMHCCTHTFLTRKIEKISVEFFYSVSDSFCFCGWAPQFFPNRAAPHLLIQPREKFRPPNWAEIDAYVRCPALSEYGLGADGITHEKMR